MKERNSPAKQPKPDSIMNTPSKKADTARTTKHLQFQITGIVQGVGFRPFIYTLAKKNNLTGTVANTGQGVTVQISGNVTDTDAFFHKLKTSPPPLAHISEIRLTEITEITETTESSDFVIVPSDDTTNRSTLISPDIAICKDCLNEILTPDNPRFHYPFTNCTNCGPRMTIIKKVPYDRTNTSMARFPMCPSCSDEYHDPRNRRFHAQPNACPKCGPELSWHDGKKSLTENNEECLEQCVQALHNGAIVAIKGLGGFHLAVDASSDKAVQRLRKKKQRYAKPLAIMAATLEIAESICLLGESEQKLLCSKERPIVLAPKKQSFLSNKLSPRIRDLGVMLAYTPLHHLLFAMAACPDVLVMTSGNLSGDPICINNHDALKKLSDIADYFLLHNRDIVTRVDDSVVRVVRGKIQTIRRSRGFAPIPLAVSDPQQSVLACGAEQKNTFCLSRDNHLFLSQHIGDLKSPDNVDFYENSICYMKDILNITPKQIVYDLHPDYVSSRYTNNVPLPELKIQHHHAHAAAIMAEHNLSAGLAVIFDGSGLGDDATIWGGEILHVSHSTYKRVAHLSPLLLPGGDTTVREIWRLGLAFLTSADIDITDTSSLPPALLETPEELRFGIAQIMKKNINTPTTSSVGRLFDAVSSLVGIQQTVDYEGQAAMELESLAWTAYEDSNSTQTGDRYTATITWNKGQHLLDSRPLLHWLLEDLKNGTPTPVIALSFHLWLTRSACKALTLLSAKENSTKNILLGGGCFLNRMLLEQLTEKLEKNGFTVYTGEKIPVNDGGISLGQAYIASQKNRVY